MGDIDNSKVYNLKLEETYEFVLDNSIKEVIINYTTLLNYYVIYSIENIKSKNINIFNKGFSLISNVFVAILMYTKSLNTAIHHTQKAILYYIEYITQITDKDENMFFNLTLKDAIVYVYTKTIYDINDNIRLKHVMTKNENRTFQIMHELIENYNNLVLFISKIELFNKVETVEKKDVLLNIHLLYNEHICKYYNNINSSTVDKSLKKVEKCNIILYENYNNNEYKNMKQILCNINKELN